MPCAALAVLAAGVPSCLPVVCVGDSWALSRLGFGPHDVEHSPDLLAACRGPCLEFRGRALGGEAPFLRLALLTLRQLFLASASGGCYALSKFRHELAGNRAIDQAAQVRERAGVYGPRLHPGAQFVEQCLGLILAAAEQSRRRGPFFGEQGIWKNQITTTLRATHLAARFLCVLWLY